MSKYLTNNAIKMYLKYLRYQTYVNLSTSQGCVHCYESTTPTHQFDNANTMVSTMCLLRDWEEKSVYYLDIITTRKWLGKAHIIYSMHEQQIWHGISSIQKNNIITHPTSIYAEFIARCASSTAVSKPNVLSINKMSLSMVFGTPTIATLNCLLRHYKKKGVGDN